MRKLAKAFTPVVAAAALLVLGTPSASRAGGGFPVPEVDPTSGIAALALVAGAVLLIRGRRKQ
jgi:hypothetical protein